MSEVKTSDIRTALWQQRINDWNESGVSRAQFCRDHELSYYVFNYWFAKFNSSMPKKNQLVPVVVANRQGPDDQSTLQIKLPNGVCITGVNQYSVDLISRLIAQL